MGGGSRASSRYGSQPSSARSSMSSVRSAASSRHSGLATADVKTVDIGSALGGKREHFFIVLYKMWQQRKVILSAQIKLEIKPWVKPMFYLSIINQLLLSMVGSVNSKLHQYGRRVFFYLFHSHRSIKIVTWHKLPFTISSCHSRLYKIYSPSR